MPIDGSLMKIEDCNFEEEVNANAYNVKTWRDYILIKSENGPDAEIALVGERAIKYLPGSYKLWILHLRNLMAICAKLCLSDPQFDAANNAFERSLCFLHKMPSIWELYLNFLTQQKRFNSFRKVFNRSLRAIPITQHERLWNAAIEFARVKGVPALLGSRIFRRYCKLNPGALEERAKYLKSIHRLDEAAIVLAKLVNEDKETVKRSKTKEKTYKELCSLMCKNPKEVESLDVNAVIRHGIERFPQSAGSLWCSLADYYLRILQFEKTRDVYEEALQTIKTARDFEFVFNTYSQFCEIMIQARMQREETSKDDTGGETKESKGDFDLSADDSELLMARYEELLRRRPLLLNSVLLRQEPNRVGYWLKRAELFLKQKEPLKVLETFAVALKTVDPVLARGKPHLLWLKLARFYEENSDDLSNVRKTFERAVKYPFRNVDDLATVWCEWIETELRHKNQKEALETAKIATTLPYKKALFEEKLNRGQNAAGRVYRSARLWAFYADLEESLGTFESTCAVYEATLDLKVATVPLILNYTAFLERNGYFERSFRALERGLALFKHPHSKPLWKHYIGNFVKRYKGEKLERTRELFEEALASIPPKSSKWVYLDYASFEKSAGKPRKSMAVLNRLCDAAEGKEKYEMFLVYLSRASELFGAIKTREIFEKALKELPDAFVPLMSLRFAALEIKLGEVDRARAILLYGAKFADTRVRKEYWREFERFEADFGNVETYADMNRVKRSVSASFSELLTEKKDRDEMDGGAKQGGSDGMRALERAGREVDNKDPDEIELGEETEKTKQKERIVQGATERLRAKRAKLAAENKS